MVSYQFVRLDLFSYAYNIHYTVVQAFEMEVVMALNDQMSQEKLSRIKNKLNKYHLHIKPKGSVVDLCLLLGKFRPPSVVDRILEQGRL